MNVHEIRLRSATRVPRPRRDKRTNFPAILAVATALALITDSAFGQTTPTSSSASSTTPSNPSSFSTAPNNPCDPSNPTSPCYSANAPRNPCYSAVASDQHCSTTTTPNSQSSPIPASPVATAPRGNRRAFTEDQAKAEIEAKGYSRTSRLRRDAEGSWHGGAEKDGVPVNVTLDLDGNVTTN